MIILDTNVLSEPLAFNPNPQVMRWLTSAELTTTAVSVGELWKGVIALPVGRRRAILADGVRAILAEFWPRILPYDAGAAQLYAGLFQGRKAGGRPLAVEDGMIAAICNVHGAAIATRNGKDFADLGVEIIDPWANL